MIGDVIDGHVQIGRPWAGLLSLEHCQQIIELKGFCFHMSLPAFLSERGRERDIRREKERLGERKRD